MIRYPTKYVLQLFQGVDVLNIFAARIHSVFYFESHNIIPFLNHCYSKWETCCDEKENPNELHR